MVQLRSLVIRGSDTFRDALKITSRSLRIAFVVEGERQFKGILTDGDIREALIAGANLDDPVEGRYNATPVTSDPQGRLSPADADLSNVYVIPVVSDGRLAGYRYAKEFVKTAFITGVTGQDGAYLAWLLLRKGYKVIGGYRRTSTLNFQRLDRLGITDQIELASFDLTDLSSAISVLQRYEPQEVYNLAAQSFVFSSFTEPIATVTYTGLGALNVLEAVRIVDPGIKFYQASSSEMYGKAVEVPQTETTPFYPRSPYGAAKVFAHWAAVNYREAYDLFACCGILFNHESPLRGREFVTRKITHAAAQIKLGLADHVELGNLEAERDWGYALDYVEAMWRIMQRDEPDDFVIATGRKHSVEEFAQTAFGCLGMDYREFVRVHRKHFRPADIDSLRGDPRKAIEKLRYNPAATSFEDLVRLMVDADLALLQGRPRLDPAAPAAAGAAPASRPRTAPRGDALAPA